MSETDISTVKESTKHTQQRVRAKSYAKWMQPTDEQHILNDSSIATPQAPFGTDKNVEATPSSFMIPANTEKPLSFVEMTAERRRPVSTWAGIELADKESAQTSTDGEILENKPSVLDHVHVPSFKRNEGEVYFRRERISMISTAERYLQPLFTWTHFGIPAPMQYHLPQKPTTIQSFALPYILDGRHALVRVIADGHRRAHELSVLCDIVESATVYEENEWAPLSVNEPVILCIYQKEKRSQTLFQDLCASLGCSGDLLKNAVRFHSFEKSAEFNVPLSRNLRYVFIDDVSDFRSAEVEKLIVGLPLHCIVVILCCSHGGKGLLSGPKARSLYSVTIAME